jgi:uncharacterized protein YbjT (DUF2867 family)
MYVVTGATGNTGRIVAEKLLAAGERVRVLGRDRGRLEQFVGKGAEAVVADATSAEAMVMAFTGADAAYLMIPPNADAPDVRAYQEQVTNALTAAVEKNGTKYVVALSSIGADKPDSTGPVVGLHHLENKLQEISGLAVLSLRAGYFMENILPQAGLIQSLGMMAGPVKGDLRLPFIATRDIGAAAAEALLRRNFSGKQVRELQGQRDVTYDELAKIVGAATGKPTLCYIQAPAGQLKTALTRMGFSASMADLLLEMASALNSGYMRALEPRSPANTTPTTIEEFVNEVFLPAFRAKTTRA